MVEPHRAVLEVRRPLEEARARILERALWQEGQARAAACHLKGVRPPSVQACDEGTQEKHSADTSPRKDVLFFSCEKGNLHGLLKLILSPSAAFPPKSRRPVSNR